MKAVQCGEAAQGRVQKRGTPSWSGGLLWEIF